MDDITNAEQDSTSNSTYRAPLVTDIDLDDGLENAVPGSYGAG